MFVFIVVIAAAKLAHIKIFRGLEPRTSLGAKKTSLQGTSPPHALACELTQEADYSALSRSLVSSIWKWKGDGCFSTTMSLDGRPVEAVTASPMCLPDDKQRRNLVLFYTQKPSRVRLDWVGQPVSNRRRSGANRYLLKRGLVHCSYSCLLVSQLTNIGTRLRARLDIWTRFSTCEPK